MGKSRLLAEFARSLDGQPVTYCEGHCLAYGSATPYLPVLALLRQRCGITDGDSPVVITAKVHQALREVDIAPEEGAPAQEVLPEETQPHKPDQKEKKGFFSKLFKK